ncbi:MAG: copper-translocating P-type ATPase [Actinomycetota bacterium]|nr:copper-translocating P-type ATPase [Actinomycetota bacterium]
MDESHEHSEISHNAHVDRAHKSDVDHSSHKGHGANHRGNMTKDLKNRFWVSALLTIPILLLSPLIQNLFGFSLVIAGSDLILFISSSAIFFCGGFPFLTGSVEELRRKDPAMMTLIALAISISYIYSLAVLLGFESEPFFFELATLIDIMLIGHYLEMKSIISAGKALEGLARLLPDTAHLIKGGKMTDIRTNDLKPGDRILIKAGERIPVDGLVLEGASYVDESMLTGESLPVKKEAGNKVVAGSLNGDGVMEVNLEKSGEGTYLNKVMELVREAQASKSRTRRLADRAARLLTFIAIISGSSTFIFWYLNGRSLSFAVERMAAVMVIACPHALGLAIPLVSSISGGLLAKKGLIIKDKAAFEEARGVTAVLFDKTGTLTEGTFEVISVNIIDDSFDETALIGLAAALEEKSEHPIAKAILKRALALSVRPSAAADAQVIKGVGIKGLVDGREVMLTSKRYAKEHNLTLANAEDEGAETLVYVIVSGRPAGVISLADRIRTESYRAIESLKAAGIKSFMLTGDNERVAKAVSAELALNGYFAEVLPHEKRDKVIELQAQGEIVAMTGDGINDAPALSTANVGIAIGSGTEIVALAADIILVKSRPSDVPLLISFSKKTFGKMIENLVWATGYNVIAIPLAAGLLIGKGILLAPATGAALMSLSTIIVAVNARRLSVER